MINDFVLFLVSCALTSILFNNPLHCKVLEDLTHAEQVLKKVGRLSSRFVSQYFSDKWRYSLDAESRYIIVANY